MDEEEREAFLEAIQAGDFSISLAFWNIPSRCRTRLLSLLRAGTLLPLPSRLCHCVYGMEGPWFIPDDVKLHRKLLRCTAR